MTNHITKYLNIGPMVKDLFFKDGGEGKWRVKTFTLAH
jgi:hypothetical protein